jgi:hypothetical protein
MIAAGLITTLTVKLLPVQVAESGVTLYVAVTALAVVLVNVPLTVLCAVAEAPPVKPVPDGADHA